MSKLQVSLLGPIGAFVDGREISLPGRQAKAVLAILALAAGRAVTVDQLLDDLWQDQLTPGANNTLQSYVSAIRRAVGDAEIVQRRGPAYVLAVEPDDVDALAFERLVGDARARVGEPRQVLALLDEALAMWRGRPLADVEGEPFAHGPIARLDELRAEALERRFDAELALGRHVELVGRLEQTVNEHPLRERFAAQLALALYRSGRQAEALRAIDRTRTRLIDELGLSPGAELLALERSILEHDPGLDTPRVANAAPVTELPRPVATSLVHALHGRDDELAQLRRHWDGAAAGDGRIVVVAGEAGVGKTRLIAELAAGVHGDGMRVVWGRCSEASRMPYEPWVEAVTAVGGQGASPGGFTQLMSTALANDPNLGVVALHEAVAGTLGDALRGGGLLVIDDVHWADRTTAAMLAHVVKALVALPVLVVIGRRSGTPNPDIDRALSELRRDGPVHRLDLRGLPADAVRRIVAEVREGGGDALAARLYERTSGNPFYVHELLAADDESLPPASITEVVALRIGPADQPLGRLLGAAAVLDRDADIDLLAEIARLEEDDALSALELALASDLLREREPGDEQVSFSHAIVRDTAYGALTGARRRRLHRQAAAALMSRYASGDVGHHQVEIARHMLAAASAANPADVIAAVETASSWCLDMLAYDEAIALARAALGIGDQAPADEAGSRTLARLRLHLARSLNRVGAPDEARAELRAVASTAIALGDSALAADAALAIGGGPGVGAGVRWGVVDTEFVDALERALRLEPPLDPERRARVLAALAQALYNDPLAIARSDEASAMAIEIAEGLDNPEVLGIALVARCIALWRPPNLHERMRLEQRAIELAAHTSYEAMAITAYIRLLPDAFEAADLDRVRSTLSALETATAHLRQRRFEWYAPLARSALALTLGDVDRAQVEADTALEAAGLSQADGPLLSHLVGMAMIERDRGRMATVEPRLREYVRHESPVMTPRVLLAVALAETGRETEALELVEPYLADDLAGVPVDYLWLGHLGLLTEVVVRAGASRYVDPVRAALSIGSGRFLMLGATAPVGAADRAIGLLTALGGDLDAATDEMTRGLDLHRRLGARYLEARSEVDLAHVHRLRGDAAAADGALERATAIAGELRLPLPSSPLDGRLPTG